MPRLTTSAGKATSTPPSMTTISRPSRLLICVDTKTDLVKGKTKYENKHSLMFGNCLPTSTSYYLLFKAVIARVTLLHGTRHYIKYSAIFSSNVG